MPMEGVFEPWAFPMEKKTSPRWTTPSRFQLENLKGNSPSDKPLQDLKEKIRQQKQRWLSKAPKEKSVVVCFMEKCPPEKPLKRKVGKVASPVGRGEGSGGRAGKKKRSQVNRSPPPKKAQKEKTMRLYGASAWREGQKLVRKILGPPVKYPKPEAGSEWDENKPITESVKEEPSLEGSFQAGQKREARSSTQTRDLESLHRSKHGIMKPPKDPGLEKRAANKENASPRCRSTSKGRSTDHNGRMSRASQQSDSPRNEAMENCKRQKGRYSPEELHEFMNRRMVERKRRSQEEKRALEQALEARRKRLQEVDRKQKEAFQRPRKRREVQRFGAASARDGKGFQGLSEARNKHPQSEVTERVRQVSSALLQNESEFRSTISNCSMGIVPSGLKMTVDYLGNGNPLKRGDLEASSFLSPGDSGSPCWSKKADNTSFSPRRTKGDRVRAIHILARDLSERLEREMERFRTGKWPVGPEDQRWAPPEMPPKAFHPSRVAWDPSHSFYFSPKAQESGERRSSLEDCLHVYASLLTPKAVHDVSPLKAKRSMVDTGAFLQHRPSLSIQSCAGKEGSQKERSFLLDEPRAERITPYSGRTHIGSFSDCQAQTGPHQNMEVEEGSVKKQPELQPGYCGDSFLQRRLSFPSANIPLKKAEEEVCDGSDPVDPTSQWSDMSQFYGNSDSFRRFGLKMVEQYLREEELRGRHQSALFRLREKALQEKARAELAWLEHEESRQDSLQAAAEKQSALLTRLKQEQAELRHLQNICRSAHRERKLLLKQQRELLAVQAATEQMWKELDERVGKSLQEIHSTQKQGAQAPLIVSSSRRAQESVDANNFCGKTGESLMEEAGKFPQKKQPVPDAEKTGVTTDKDLHFRREYPINSTLTDAGPKETEGYLLKEEQDTGLMKNSKEECLCSSMDTALQCSHPITPSDELYGFSLDFEKPRLESGFHTARAVLINISGSSPSSLEEEEEDQDTDISLPEEFIIQDEMFCGTPTVPRIGINTSPSSGGRSHTQIRGGPSNQVDLSNLCSQEGKPSSEKTNRSAFIILSSDGSPRSSSVGMGGSHSGQANGVFIGRDVSSLKDSELEKMAFQEDAGSEDVSCSEGSFNNLKDPKKQQIGSTTEEDDHENPTYSKLVGPKVSLKDVSPIDGEMQVFPSESQNPSDPLLISDNSKGHAEYSIGESNLFEDPTSNGSLCPQTMEGTTKEDQNGPTASSQSSMRSRVVSSSKDEERSEDDKILISEEHPPGIEEEIVSPVDEVLSYGSTDLPSAISFPSGDLPAPPEENAGGSDFSLSDFPSPPEELVFLESGELRYASDEEASITTNGLSSLSDDPELEDLPSQPLASADVSLGQEKGDLPGTDCFSGPE